ncbi:CHAT domain-containing protein [Flavihumibacter sp. UBA7668]|uniref:CHAT domain-containing protein n=1 Tax=Flavihumibacter sp. UBA7668 TaxID=1946542 RepID=UPI0025C70B49|nr:CHAT domain-containing tetratricopeptide repeat protein [Flavihumibacter sp. UBA7668]
MKKGLIFLLICCVNQLFAQTNYEKSVNAYKALQYDSAMIYIDQAVSAYKSLNQTDSLVFALVQKADMIWSLKGNAAGLSAAESAVQVASRLPFFNPAQVAALDKKGQILIHNEETEKGKKTLYQALEHIDKTAPPNNIYATLYKNLSWLLMTLQDFEPALQYAENALQITEKLYGKDARLLLGVYQSLMLICHDSGKYTDAETYGLELLRLANLNLSAHHPNKGLVHNDLGILYETMHRYDEALYHKQEMVRIIQLDYAKHKNPQLMAIAYNNMGSFYQNIGEAQLSLDYYDKAKKLHEINFGSEGAGIVRPLTHLANMKMAVGAFEEADSLYTRAYRIQQEVDPKDWRNLAYVESQYGDLFYEKKDFAKAEIFYLKSLENSKKAGIKNTSTVPQTRTTLAETYAQQRRINEALPILNEVLQLYRSTYPAGDIVLAGQYNKISKAFLLNKQLNKALVYSDSTFQELLQVSALPKQGWVEKLPYNQYIILYIRNRAEVLEGLYQQKKDTLFLKQLIQLAGEYGGFLSNSLPALRTQGSVMQVSSNHKTIYNTAIEACWDLYKQSGNFRHLHKAFEFAERSKGLLLRLSANNMLNDVARAESPTETKADLDWRKRIGSLNAQYLDADRKNDSLLFLLTSAMEGYRKFQDSLLKTGTAGIQLKYNLHPATVPELQGYLKKQDQTLLEYVLTDKHIFLFTLNAKQFHVHRLPNRISKDVAALKELYTISAANFKTPAFRLYQQLIQPVEAKFSGKNLLVIPDGELFYLNMELLISDNKANDFAGMPYLLNTYNISYQLSATNALLMKSVAAAKQNKALLLTPVFTDEMKKAYRDANSDSAAIDPYYLNLLRQPFTLQAAKKIGKLLNHDLFAGQDALESVVKTNAAAYSILHLGTHAEVNHSAPLQSRFYMAKPVPLDSSGKDDGYLHAYEIYGLPLQADLAVLTACETGQGNWVGGEGVISLAHSFMYAGCPSVVMSLWKIDEKSSAEIITNFYKELANGSSKSEALRQAKLQHIKEASAQSHPYFWAGMTLVGDTDPVYPSRFWWWILAAALLAATTWWLYQKKTRK